MPKLIFPVSPSGLQVDAVVGQDGLTTSVLIATGQTLTAPILTRGEIDTGSNMSAVSTAVLRQLGVPV